MARTANVVVTAYSTTPWMQDVGIGLFDEETILVEVPFTLQGDEKLADKAFGRTVQSLKDWTSGSVLRNLFKRDSRLKGVDIKSIAVITFSAGTTFAKAVLDGADREYVDTIICIDGLHIPKNWQGEPMMQVLQPWIDFGERAAFDERMMVLADTDIIPFNHNQITSTSESDALVLDGVDQNLSEGSRRYLEAPNYIDYRNLLQNTGARTWSNIGNLWVLEYGGGQAADHIRVAKQASEAIWRTFLVPRWNQGVTCRMPDLAGLGSVECTPNRVVVPEGAYQPNVVRDYVLPGVIAAAVFGGTYWAGTQLAKRYLL